MASRERLAFRVSFIGPIISAMPGWKRALNLILLALIVTACEGLPIPQVTLVTRTPAPPPGPTATSLPAELMNFSVVVPGNTPGGSQIAVQLVDDVTGGRTLVLLNSVGNNVWNGSAPAIRGEVVRYRYVRTQPSFAEEVTPLNHPVPYRLFLVTEGSATATDIVAAWSDTRWGGGDQGAVAGAVRNSNTGQGVPDVIVSAAGQLTLTAWDGSYSIYNVPAGNQRVTILAADGSLRPTQNSVLVPPSQIATLDLNTPDPNAVHVTFVVRPPANTDPAAEIRLIGNVAQMGDIFALTPNGMAVVPARAPVLSPLNDGTGRYAWSLQLYEGTLLRYAYTLGDGFWNPELDATGGKRLRQFLVPITDYTQNDTIASWHTGTSAAVTFDVTTPANTPPNDLITLQFRTTQWLPPLAMWRTGLRTWRFVLNYPENFDGAVGYRYCRNYACGAADDEATAGRNPVGRSFTPTLLPQSLKDEIRSWRWFGEAPPVNLALPPPAPRGGFNGGFDLAEAWQPHALPFYPETVRTAQTFNANFLTVFRRGLMRHTAPPLLADDLALTMPLDELRTLVEQAHAAGLRVMVHPVTCDYTPYGPCDYWASFNAAYWNDWFAAYERFLLTQADVAKAAGADGLVVGDYKLQPALPNEPGAPVEANSRWRNLIARVRQRFSGQLAFELLVGQDVWPNAPQFLDAVDVIRVHWWAPLGTGFATSRDDMLNAAVTLVDGKLKPLADRFGKPLHLSIVYYSTDGGVTHCLPRPDGICHAFSDFNPDAPEAPRYGLDLGEQTDAYNAVLSAVHVRPYITGVSAFGYNPVVALRDQSISVRGKPAEVLLGAWFLRFQGR